VISCAIVRPVQSHIQRSVETLNLRRVGRALAYSVLIGLVAGAGAIAFQYLSELAHHYLLSMLSGYRPSGPDGEIPLFAHAATIFRPWMLPVVPALGGLATGLIVQRFAPEAAGHGTDAAIDAFHRGGGVIRGHVPIVKTIASAITLGSGGSGGREGPIAQIGAGFGSFLATRLRLSERDRRILLAAGVGAGVGSIFRAPLAGALFAAEILYSDPEFESEVVIPAAMSSIVAYCVFSLKFGFGTLFTTPAFTFHSPWELLPYTALALLSAIGAGMFVRVFYRLHDGFEALRLPAWLKPAVGGLLAGTLALALYLVFADEQVLNVMSFGYGAIQKAIYGELPILILLAIALGKMVTTGLSIGSGGSAGVFGPSMVIGGSIGGIVGLVAQRLMPDIVAQPGAFVVVGMAGFFSAAAKTPISTLVMVSEMTGNYHLLLPSLWVCSLSFLIGRRWRLYRSQVPTRLDSPAYRGAIFVDILTGLRVRDVMNGPAPRTVSESATLRQLIPIFTASTQHYFPVVSADGRMTGILSANDIRALLDRVDSAEMVIAHDIMTSPAVTVSLDDDLNVVMQRFVTLDVEELPVTRTGAGEQVVGMISRHDVMSAYNRRRLERMQAAAEANRDR
jgi:CIC family chloride channel protein